jgi:hypothetical protein
MPVIGRCCLFFFQVFFADLTFVTCVGAAFGYGAGSEPFFALRSVFILAKRAFN